MNHLKRIGAAIRKRRYAGKLSQEDLAGLAEIDRTYISGIENGRRRISLETFIRLAQAMKVEPWKLLKEALD